MNKLNKVLRQATIAATAATALQTAVCAQHGAGYYYSPVPRNPIDIRMSALYNRLDSMYNSGLLAPQERAELVRDLDGIQWHELKARCFYPYGMSKHSVQHLNRELDVFTARLDARGA